MLDCTSRLSPLSKSHTKTQTALLQNILTISCFPILLQEDHITSATKDTDAAAHWLRCASELLH